jgi:ABC-type polysaccharide/polyol phosphate transport system ATPase subunit
MAHAAVIAEGVSKVYPLGERTGQTTLREALPRLLRRGRPAVEEVAALREVDLRIETGETLGIVGRNGAGKSTLLKLIARITEPTRGEVRIRGRVGSLLEVGTGFHAELTGRENVFLNGAVLGMSRRDVARRFDDIATFAGVERFLDTPLKRYSTGMQLRLAFAVAAHLEPDIVVVDEVLAVGDAEFQERCLGRMSQFRDEGRTVIFVSHDMGAVARLCRRALWLDDGRTRADGDPADTIASYLNEHLPVATQATFESQAQGDGPIELVSASIDDTSGRSSTNPRRDEPLRVVVSFRASQPIPGADIALALLDQQGVPILDELWSECGKPQRLEPGELQTVELRIPPLLAPGEYVLSAWIGTAHEEFFYSPIMRFRLWPTPLDRTEAIQRRRVIQPDVAWDWRVGP